jgi:hypothetical protein
VSQVGVETVLALQGGLKWGEGGLVHLLHSAALLTYEVVVVPFHVEVVAQLAVPQGGLGY